MSDLSQRIAALSTEKRAFLLQRLQQQEHKLRLPLVRKIHEGMAPLSLAQQRLWLLEQLAPETAAYTIPLAFQFKGPLHITALEQSLNEIIRRHEILRTSFALVGNRPAQIIAPDHQLEFARTDLQEICGDEREHYVHRLMNQEARYVFDLRQSPLIHVHLLRMAEQEHILLLNMHHLVSDGWSVGVLWHELTVLYHAFLHSQPSPLPPLAIQYADFARWQHERLAAGFLQPQLAYWKHQLIGAPTLLQLPTDHPRPTRQTFHGASVPVCVSAPLTDALKHLGQQQGVTLFMILLAAFQVLLSGYSGQQDLMVGTPIAGRTQRQTEDLIGFFVNTLVLRTDLSGDPRFSELLSRVRDVALEAYAHQEAPFERIVEEVLPRRDLSHNPLFQVMFALQNAPLKAADLPGLQVQPLVIESTIAQFDLTLDLSETPQGLVGCLEYNTDLFEAATITRMAGYLQALLATISNDPDQPISMLAC